MHLRQFFLFLSSLPSMTNAFSLSVGTASECDPFTVSWTGGENPFEIYTFPVSPPHVHLGKLLLDGGYEG